MTRTPLEAYISHAESDITFFRKRVESEILWLEGNIRELRREMESGIVFPQRNLGSKAVDVVEAVGKLIAAHECLGILKDIASAGGES